MLIKLRTFRAYATILKIEKAKCKQAALRDKRTERETTVREIKNIFSADSANLAANAYDSFELAE